MILLAQLTLEFSAEEKSNEIELLENYDLN